MVMCTRIVFLGHQSLIRCAAFFYILKHFHFDLILGKFWDISIAPFD